MTTDRDLIDRYRSGDQAAFAEFYGRHRRPLFVYIISLVRHRETAEELLQETFFALISNLSRLDGSLDLRPFLVRAARNRAVDFLRRKRVGARALERRAEELLFKSNGGGSPEGPGDPERLSALLLSLPEEQREAILLKVCYGMTFGEIARAADCPEGSVVSRYRYGLEKLRAALARGGCVDGTR